MGPDPHDKNDLQNIKCSQIGYNSFSVEFRPYWAMKFFIFVFYGHVGPPDL
jgi:hypothetical protein